METKLINDLTGVNIVTSEMIQLVNALKANFKTGTYPLANGAYAKSLNYTTSDESECYYENHKCFISIHIVLDGQEVIWVASAADPSFLPVKPYEPDTEVLYGAVRNEEVIVNNGEFLILHPGQAHKSGCTIPTTPAREVKKIIIKVPYTMRH